MEYREIPEEERPNFLLRNHEQPVRFESLVFSTMEKITSGAYSGGLWQFRQYENGAAVMVFDEEGDVAVINPMNYYDGSMSWEAASLAVNAMVSNWIGEYDMYWKIMDVVHSHPEAPELYKLLD